MLEKQPNITENLPVSESSDCAIVVNPSAVALLLSSCVFPTGSAVGEELCREQGVGV